MAPEQQSGFKGTDLLVVLVVIFVFLLLASMLLPALARSREGARQNACKNNLLQIGESLFTYRQASQNYFAFSWGPPDAAPDAFNNAAASSLGLLYPQYLKNSNAFRCPSTENEPIFTLSVTHQSADAAPAYTLGDSVYNPVSANQSSYGYDPRVTPRAVGGLAIAADMDGGYRLSVDTSTQNHEQGQNVLYVDNHAKWETSNLASNDPNDNIFYQDAWDADTDSYLVRGDRNDLTLSFDSYSHLK